MRIALNLREVGWSRDGSIMGTGTPSQYEVNGMPGGQGALIYNAGAPERDDWRLMRIQPDGRDAGWQGEYQSAGEALADLEKQMATAQRPTC
jgi:hypothetical protein